MDVLLNVLRDFGMAFVPLFVAMDAVSAVPIVLAMTQEMNNRQRNQVVRYGMITALALGLIFLIIGKAILLFLGIAVNDFLIAGGAILFLLAAKELVVGKMVDVQAVHDHSVGVVPLGTPLVVGPAVLTTLMLLIDQYHIVIVLAAFLINILLAWFFFSQSNRLVKLLGRGGVLALSKVFALLLAAIAVSMVHRGISALQISQ